MLSHVTGTQIYILSSIFSSYSIQDTRTPFGVINTLRGIWVPAQHGYFLPIRCRFYSLGRLISTFYVNELSLRFHKSLLIGMWLSSASYIKAASRTNVIDDIISTGSGCDNFYLIITYFQGIIKPWNKIITYIIQNGEPGRNKSSFFSNRFFAWMPSGNECH